MRGFADEARLAVERHGGSETMRREGADVVVHDVGELLDPALR